MTFLQRYEHAIDQIVRLCPQPDKFAHTYAGLLVWVAAALLLRRSLASLWPLLVVVAFELGNEYIDYLAHGSWRWRDTWRDMAATWFWPLALMLVLRAAPWLGAAPRRKGR